MPARLANSYGPRRPACERCQRPRHILCRSAHGPRTAPAVLHHPGQSGGAAAVAVRSVFLSSLLGPWPCRRAGRLGTHKVYSTQARCSGDGVRLPPLCTQRGCPAPPRPALQLFIRPSMVRSTMTPGSMLCCVRNACEPGQRTASPQPAQGQRTATARAAATQGDEKFSTTGDTKKMGWGMRRCGGGQVGLGFCLLGGERRTAREGKRRVESGPPGATTRLRGPRWRRWRRSLPFGHGSKAKHSRARRRGTAWRGVPCRGRGGQ